MGKQGRSTLVTIVGFFIAMWALGQAAMYGERWQSMTHPTPDVTVVLHGNVVLKGAYHVEWDGSEVIVGPDGTATHFAGRDLQVMTVHAPIRLTGDFSAVDHWRELLPISLVGLLTFAFLLRGLLAPAMRLWIREGDASAP